MHINKIVMLMVGVLILSMGIVQAQNQESLKPIKINSCIELKQTCANCTSVNFTRVAYPNSSTAATDLEATRDGTNYNYTFCNNTEFGYYIVDSVADVDGVLTGVSFDYLVSPDGMELDTSKSIIYIFMLVLGCCLFVFFIWGATKINIANMRNEYDEVIAVNKNKHIRTFLVVMAYVTFVWIFYIAWNLSIGYLNIGGIADFFYAIHRISFVLMYPILVLTVIISLIIYIKDLNLEKAVNRGMIVP